MKVKIISNLLVIITTLLICILPFLFNYTLNMKVFQITLALLFFLIRSIKNKSIKLIVKIIGILILVFCIIDYYFVHIL